MIRIGMLTSGGDCQALNATMRGVYKSVKNNAKEPVEFYGFEDGYKGLMYGKFRVLNDDDFSNILTTGRRTEQIVSIIFISIFLIVYLILVYANTAMITIIAV